MEAQSSLYSFKTYARASRVQRIEDDVSKGMQVTNVPLPEGYGKYLVNYDIKDDGVALKTRPGLRINKVLVPDYNSASDAMLLDADAQILTAKVQQIQNENVAQMFIKPKLPGDTTQRTAPIYMATGTHQAVTTKMLEGLTEERYNILQYPNARYVVSQDASIHDLPVADTHPIARQVGTYAWNNNYYFFDPVLKKVVHSELDPNSYQYVFKADDPDAITPRDAVTYGYNMLAPDPYTFVNKQTPDETHINFTGLLPYNEKGELQLTPVMNQSLKFVANYTAPKTSELKLIWEWRAVTDTAWTKLKEETVTVNVSKTESTELSVTLSPPAAAIVLRVEAFPAKAENNLAVATLAVGFNFKKSDYGATANIAVQRYDLYTSTGMCYWKNRLLVWGVKDAANILFASDINNPTYFPYPNNTDTFTEPIKYALPFLDNLLVFTSTTVYICTLAEDGQSWTHKTLQSNLTINDWDIHLIQVVKNMVFFRSGNYFYMVVPKRTSMTGELVVAAISKPLINFFDHFQENVEYMLSTMYNKPLRDLQLVHYYDFLDFEDMHVCYVFKNPYIAYKESYINFCMLYNITDRSWRAYVYASTKPIVPYAQDVTQKGKFCTMTSVKDRQLNKMVIEILQYDLENCSDFYLIWNADCTRYHEDFEANHFIRNWQYLDSGFREHNSNFKKRYREIQFMINNQSQTSLNFYTEFSIDGELRSTWYEYQVTQNTDQFSPDYGTIVVERVVVNPQVVPGSTVLAPTEKDTQYWQLDVSKFPTDSTFKVRFPVSGKGYAPRLTIVSPNEFSYELLNMSWVYRELYSR